MTLDELLQEMIDKDASDLHLKHGAKISYRIDGEIEQLGPVVSGEDIYDFLTDGKAISSEQQRMFLRGGSVDFSYTHRPTNTRFRGSLIYEQEEKPSCVFRKINSDIIPINELDLPPVIKKLALAPWGMVLVTGPTGSGKSTTLASVIDYINQKRKYNIYTLENPLEFVHKNKKSIITQREVPTDASTFANGMVDALRQDPDVILVGEMRDEETISAAMTSAETGHLVFGTLHTNTAPHSINRILDEHPTSEHHKIRGQLASNLRAIVSQRLFPNPNGGRTSTFEVMVLNDEMRKLIREGKIEDLYEVMRRNRKEGNILMEDSIEMAKKKGLIRSDIIW